MTTNETSSSSSPGPCDRNQSMYCGEGQALESILLALNVPCNRPVLALVGWAGANIRKETTDAHQLLMEAVLAPACRETGAVVVSGGTDAGVMALLGAAMAEFAPDTVLVGVAPNAKLIGYGADANDDDAARPEPRHRLVRTPGAEWGCEGTTLVRVAERIAGNCGVVVLAVGGGAGTHRELILAAERRWPVVLVTGGGGVSEDVASALRTPSVIDGARNRELDEKGQSQLLPVEVAAAASDGCFREIDFRDRPGIGRALRWRLSSNAVLREAWVRFAAMDLQATTRKRPTALLVALVITLATLTLLCASVLGFSAGSEHRADLIGGDTGRDVFKGATTALPLMAAILLGVIERRGRVGSWVELRAAAESILREIYRYRGSSGVYGDPDAGDMLFGDALSSVDARTSGRTAVLPGSFMAESQTWPPVGLDTRIPACDSLLGPLTAPVYDKGRVVNQLDFLSSSVTAQERKASRLAFSIFAVAGGAAFLVALSWRWGDLAAGAGALASLTAALLAWREFRQWDARAEAMLSTYVSVRASRGRWLASTMDERNSPSRLSTFVAEIEDALATENLDWERALQQSQKVLLDRYRGR